MKTEKILTGLGIIFIILIIFSVSAIFGNMKSYEKIRKQSNIEEKKAKDIEMKKVKVIQNENKKNREQELKNKYQSKTNIKELEKLSRKIEEKPAEAELYYERAEIYRKLDESKKAYNDYTKAIELDKKAKYYISRAGMFKISDEVKIYDDLQKALEISCGSNTYEGVGEVYYYYGDYDNARKCFQEAIKKNPKKSELYVEIVNCEQENNNVIKLCNEYIKKFPNEYKFYLLKADAILSIGEDINKTEIDKILRKESNKIGGAIYNKMGCINLYNKKYKEAINNFNKAIELELKYKPAYYMSNIEAYYKNKEIVYKEIRDYKSAIEALEKLIEYNLKNDEDGLKMNSRDSYEKIAEYYEMLSDEKKVSENYEKAKEIAEYQSYLD